MQRDKLYTATNSNRYFLTPFNTFDWGGLAMQDKQQNPWNYADDLDTTEQYKNSTNFFGISKADNPFSKGNLAGGLKAMAGTSLFKGVAGGLGSAVGSIGNNLISDGYSSGAGSAISGIGSTLGSAIGTVNPVLGAAVSAASGIVGGLTNRAFGTKVDQEALNKANEETNYFKNFTSNAANFDDVKTLTGAANIGNVYKGGWFSKGSASRKNNELLQERINAQNFAVRSIGNNINNIADDQYNDALANYAAFGGYLGLTPQGDYLSPISSSNPDYDFTNAFSNDPITTAFNLINNNSNIDEEFTTPNDEAINILQQKINSLETQNNDLQALINSNINTNSSNSNILNHYSSNASKHNSTSKYSSTPSSKSGKEAQKYIKQQLQKSGKFNKTQIEGILQNINRESGFNINSVSDGGKSFGLLQWHSNRAPKDKSLKGQTQYIIDTLSHYDGNKHWMGKENYTGFLNARTPEEAHYYIAKGFERPSQGIINDLRRNAEMSLGKIKALGGIVSTHGSNFSNGLMSINEGGSHEENPFNGVPFGMDDNGVPNLVEEGETVYNNYVYSRRLKVPKGAYKELGLTNSGKKGISFADASKKIAEESEDRPNDPISKKGLQAGLLKLAMLQEQERSKQNPEEGQEGNRFDNGGKINPYAYDDIKNFKYFKDGKYDEGYLDFINNKLNDDWINRAMSGAYGDMSRYKGANNFNPTLSRARALGQDKLYSDWHKAMANAYDEYLMGVDPKTGLPRANMFEYTPSTKLNIKLPETEAWKNVDNSQKENDDIPTYNTALRYAPAVASGIMTLTDALGITNKPDYTYADKLEALASKVSSPVDISYKPIGNYLTYNPMDIWFEQNRMSADARATDRAILNSNVSSGAKMAGLLASGYNNQISNGQLYRNALDYNNNRRKEVADFNRQTNMFNSQMDLEAATANARFRQQAQQLGLSGLAQAAALRDSIDQRVGAARSANISNFINSLGNIGRENFAFNVINKSKSRNYGITDSGNISHKKNR
jgi:hypothetical protein